MSDGENVVAVDVFVDGEAWTRISSLSEAGPDDKVFVLDPEDGMIVFGDGVRGKQPPEGSEVTVSYRYGGGSAGNVGASMTGQWPFERRSFLINLDGRGCQIRPLESVTESGSGKKRLRFFEGQMLTASDLVAEQNYFLGQNRRHNRWLHGVGIVSGLEVTVGGDAQSPSVVVSSGYAIDPEGRELIVREPISLCTSDKASPQFVALKYLEKKTDYIPSPDPDHNVPSRIEDCVLVLILPEPQKCEALIIGRLVKGTQGWKVDPTFQPPRSR